MNKKIIIKIVSLFAITILIIPLLSSNPCSKIEKGLVNLAVSNNDVIYGQQQFSMQGDEMVVTIEEASVKFKKVNVVGTEELKNGKTISHTFTLESPTYYEVNFTCDKNTYHVTNPFGETLEVPTARYTNFTIVFEVPTGQGSISLTGDEYMFKAKGTIKITYYGQTIQAPFIIHYYNPQGYQMEINKGEGIVTVEDPKNPTGINVIVINFPPSQWFIGVDPRTIKIDTQTGYIYIDETHNTQVLYKILDNMESSAWVYNDNNSNGKPDMWE